MLVTLREVNGGSETTINPQHVLSVESIDSNSSKIKMVDGKILNVLGSLQEVTKLLNGNKRLLKG